MSNVVPTFEVGDFIRVMDTEWVRDLVGTQGWDLANKQGTVVRKATYKNASASFVAIPDLGIFVLPNSCLQKYTPPGVVLGKLRVAITRIANENLIDLNGTGPAPLLDRVVQELWQILNS